MYSAHVFHTDFLSPFILQINSIADKLIRRMLGVYIVFAENE